MEQSVKTHKRKSKNLVDPGDLVSEKSLDKIYTILGRVIFLSTFAFVAVMPQYNILVSPQGCQEKKSTFLEEENANALQNKAANLKHLTEKNELDVFRAREPSVFW